jgi:DNA-binding MarR family transcriptional regulator
MSFPSDLTDHTGYWLRMVSNAVSQGFARRVAGQGVTVAEWVVLRLLQDEDGVAPSVLAQRMGMTRGAVSKLADRLLAKGLISRAADAADKRGHFLALTAAGRAKVPVLAALADANDVDHFGVLTGQERAALDRLLRAMAGRLGRRDVPLD